MTVTLGINAAYHEDACAICVNGRLVAFAEEERFNRRKHAKHASLEGPRALPYAAIDYCLQEAGVSMTDVDLLGYSFNPARRVLETSSLDYPYKLPAGSWGTVDGELAFAKACLATPMLLGDRYGREIAERVSFLDHHLCHAASAYYFSHFAHAAVLVVDGIGEEGTAWIGEGHGSTLRTLDEMRFPASLGLFWERMAELCGFGPYDASYLMGLAAYGGPSNLVDRVSSLLPLQGGLFEADDAALGFRRAGPDGNPDPLLALEAHLGVSRRKKGDNPLVSADLAWAAQHVLEDRLKMIVDRAALVTSAEALCFAGGVALNCVANGRLFGGGPFAELFVQPAANDAGTAAGAALLCAAALDRKRPYPTDDVYLGPANNLEAIELALQAQGLDYSRVDSPAEVAAQILTQGGIVAWFQGRMEAGPRALGNRSLLADPRNPQMRETLNRKVKHREDFRPFCPSVLVEDVHDWFELPAVGAHAARYMLYACPVRAERRDLVPAVVHVDGSARLQTVDRDTNPLYWDLISSFAHLTGVPMVLNTSFNDSEPIVCSIEDAVATFLATEIDYLIAGSFLVRRPDRPILKREKEQVDEPARA